MQVEEFFFFGIQLICLKREMLPSETLGCENAEEKARKLAYSVEMVSKYVLSSFLTLTTYLYS
jgi:hypothetical protein